MNLAMATQVELFLGIKEALLIMRQERIECHQKEAEMQESNLKALHSGNDIIKIGQYPTQS